LYSKTKLPFVYGNALNLATMAMGKVIRQISDLDELPNECNVGRNDSL
jgi:hypothetical protein